MLGHLVWPIGLFWWPFLKNLMSRDNKKKIISLLWHAVIIFLLCFDCICSINKVTNCFQCIFTFFQPKAWSQWAVTLKDFPIFVLPGHLTKMSFFRGQIYIWHLFPYWGNSRVLCNIQGVSGANEYPFEGSFAQIVILFSRDIISHDEVALQHVIWYALYLCKLWYKV